MSEKIRCRSSRRERANLDEIVAARAEATRAALRQLVREERVRLIAESYRRAYEAAPQEDWIGETGASALGEALARELATRAE